MFGKNPENRIYFTDSYFRGIDNRQGITEESYVPTLRLQPVHNLKEPFWMLVRGCKGEDCIEEKKGQMHVKNT